MSKDKPRKLKPCKKCGGMIADNAKVCPHCGAQVPQFGCLGAFLIWLGVIVLIGVITSIAGNGDDKNAPEKLEYSLNETASYNEISITLKSVDETTGRNYIVAEDGYVYVICEFEIENNSDDDLALSTMLSFDAYADDYAVELSLGAMASSSLPQLDGTVAPGKKMDGVVGWQVPEGWWKLEVSFLANVWEGSKITFVYEK